MAKVEGNFMEKKRIIIGATGASGMPLLKRCLEIIKAEGNFESYLILSRSAEITIEHEMKIKIDEIEKLADYVLSQENIGAGPASGSFKNEGMLIVPCSMKTAAGICSGYTDNLILRSADVAIKEQRKLVLAVRESPLSQIHLRNLYELSKIPNVRIIPPMLTFYHMPENIDDMVNHIAAKLLEPFGIEMEGYRRWKGLNTE